MISSLRKLGFLVVAALLVGARGFAPLPPIGEYVEVRQGDNQTWVLVAHRTVDDVLVSYGHSALGVAVAVPRGTAVVKRGAGWAIESASLPQLEGVPVDLNRAPRSALVALPGIGASKAAAIEAARPYRSVAELDNARGLGPATVAALQGQVTVHHRVPAPGKTRLNCATTEVLDRLPGVGPVLAGRIIEGRPYASLEELDAVRGIGPATLDRLRPLVRVGSCP